MMHKYAKELSQYHVSELPDLPDSWKTITLEQAKASLNRLSTATFTDIKTQ